LNIPPRKITVEVPSDAWKASPSDDPIQDWDEDIIGRTAIVELLAEHALVLGTPVISLHGGLGDGKSSVLNLLRKALEGQAIVVSFNAWLPGREATFAVDLFGDIATECRKHVHFPQLRKRALLYARTISGSVSYLAGLRELLPADSQLYEINELKQALARVPLPIVVLLDEMDKMQKEELLVVLKVLRGVASIPNMTFVCAFNEAELRRRLWADEALPYDYLEKFFPVSVNLAPPDSEMLGKLFQAKLMRGLKDQSCFREQTDETTFTELLRQLWRESVSRLCTNFRKAGLLLNDILLAARPIAGEVNAFDLTGIECLRRFYPDVHSLLRKNSVFLTYEESSWEKRQYLFLEERKQEDSRRFFEQLDAKITQSEEPEAATVLLSYLFPEYAAVSNKRKVTQYSLTRPTSQESAESEKRICHPDYFPIYFRAAVPGEMFSNAELQRVISDLNQAQSPSEIDQIFGRVLDEIPKQHPKREDFLWKISRSVVRLKDEVAERLAYAAASRATDYAYDIMNIGEAARALNIVFEAAQKLSATLIAQRVLVGAMTRATDDTFARRIWEYTRDRNRNKILIDFSNVALEGVKEAFMQRMRHRYGPEVPIETINIAQGDWWAFRSWVENSAEDRQIEQDFWRRYIGQSRKRLAQAINFIYPPGVSWDQDPTPIVNTLFPVEDVRRLLQNLAQEDQLDEIEAKGIERFTNLFEGKWYRTGQIPEEHARP